MIEIRKFTIESEMNQEEISKSLVNTIKSPELEALATNFAEITIDQLSDVEGVAKEVPVVDSIVNRWF